MGKLTQEETKNVPQLPQLDACSGGWSPAVCFSLFKKMAQEVQMPEQTDP